MESAEVINPFLPDAWALHCRQIRVEAEIVTIVGETVAPRIVWILSTRGSKHHQLR